MPISDCEVRDPRIRRTRQLLQGALRTLLKTKRFDEISVQDITEAATVNRATFYDHYTDKYALLEALVAGGFHQFLSERQVSYDNSCPSAAGRLILAVCDYQVECHAGASCDGHNAFEPLIEAAIVNAVRRVLMGSRPESEPSQMPLPTLHAAAASWAIYGAVKEWFNTPERAPADQIVPEILTLIAPILQAAGPKKSLAADNQAESIA